MTDKQKLGLCAFAMAIVCFVLSFAQYTSLAQSEFALIFKSLLPASIISFLFMFFLGFVLFFSSTGNSRQPETKTNPLRPNSRGHLTIVK